MPSWWTVFRWEGPQGSHGRDRKLLTPALQPDHPRLESSRCHLQGRDSRAVERPGSQSSRAGPAVEKVPRALVRAACAPVLLSRRTSLIPSLESPGRRHCGSEPGEGRSGMWPPACLPGLPSCRGCGLEGLCVLGFCICVLRSVLGHPQFTRRVKSCCFWQKLVCLPLQRFV